jgi:enoyl-CoA hydratase
LSDLILQPHSHYPSVREIVLHRAEKRNALTLSMWQQLRDFISMCNEDPTVRVIVLRSSDARVFCSGADISEFPLLRSDAVLAEAHKAITDVTTVSLATARPITVAAISGICYGGGVQLATACDIRLAENTSTFAITPLKLGFLYGPYETELLFRAAGEALAKDMLLSARCISAHLAFSRGLVTDLCPGNLSYSQFLDDYLGMLLSVAPQTQQNMKRVIHSMATTIGVDSSTTSVDKIWSHYHEMNDGFSIIADASEYQEGFQSFLEKRMPSYREMKPQDSK